MTALASLCQQYPTMKERLKYEAMLKFAYDDPEAAESASYGGHSQVQGDAMEQVKRFYKDMMENVKAAAEKDARAAAAKPVEAAVLETPVKNVEMPVMKSTENKKKRAQKAAAAKGDEAETQ